MPLSQIYSTIAKIVRQREHAYGAYGYSNMEQPNVLRWLRYNYMERKSKVTDKALEVLKDKLSYLAPPEKSRLRPWWDRTIEELKLD